MQFTLIIPTYNEADGLVGVIEEWRAAIVRCLPAGQFRILVIDDGSKDGTRAKLEAAQLKIKELVVHHQSNQGHGQACLTGYRLANQMGSDYVMQIDSDGQCDPVFFPGFWAERGPVPLYGQRHRRYDGLFRKLTSLSLRWTLYGLTGTRLHDTNVPYRLYPARMAASVADQVPATFDLANIAVALLLEPYGFKELPIHFLDRTGGTPSVKWLGFIKKAFRLVSDLKSLQKILKGARAGALDGFARAGQPVNLNRRQMNPVKEKVEPALRGRHAGIGFWEIDFSHKHRYDKA